MPPSVVSLQPEPSQAIGARPTDRDVQRATLRDLASLATDCAATESEIERRYAREVEEEKTKYERLKSDIAHRFATLREEIQNTQQNALAQAEETFEKEMAALKEADEGARQKVEIKHELVQQEVKKKY